MKSENGELRKQLGANISKAGGNTDCVQGKGGFVYSNREVIEQGEAEWSSLEVDISGVSIEHHIGGRTTPLNQQLHPHQRLTFSVIMQREYLRFLFVFVYSRLQSCLYFWKTKRFIEVFFFPQTKDQSVLKGKFCLHFFRNGKAAGSFKNSNLSSTANHRGFRRLGFNLVVPIKCFCVHII